MQISISNPNLNKLKICKYPHISAGKGLKRAVCTIRWTGSGGRVWRGGAGKGVESITARRVPFLASRRLPRGTLPAPGRPLVSTGRRYGRSANQERSSQHSPPTWRCVPASALPAGLPVRDSRFTGHRRFTFSCSINSRILLYPREFMVREWNNLAVIDDRGKLIEWDFSLDVNFVILFFFFLFKLVGCKWNFIWQRDVIFLRRIN